MNIKLPNFLIVGAAKAGTSSLYHYLGQHPEIFVSKKKEPFFLSCANEKNICTKGLKPITDFKKYYDLFSGSKNYKAVGEASTTYLYYHEKTIKNIKKYIPNYKNLKIIISLRNPVDRLYSHYMMKRRNGEEIISLDNALAKEKDRMKNYLYFGFFYVNLGLYYEQVKAYLENFKNVKIILLDDLKNNPSRTVSSIYSFLGVDSNFNQNLQKVYNVSGTPKLKFINYLAFSEYKFKRVLEAVLPKFLRTEMLRLVATYNLAKMPLADNKRQKLKLIFADDIKKLSILIDRDLSSWL